MKRVLVPASIFVFLCALASAQDPRGTIAGRVIDRLDSVDVGAKVQVANVQTAVRATVLTNDAGAFTVPFRIPGTYRVTAEMAGFKTASLENVELRVADTLNLTVRLRSAPPPNK